MAETKSNMLPLGTKAPDFKLLDTVSNQYFTLGNLKSDIATVVMFICNHCPYVKLIQKKLVEVAINFQAKGIYFIGINSNDVIAYPEDGPDFMKHEAKKLNYPFPYLFDESQQTARDYLAACTPDFYIFDHDLRCVYRGRFDDATPKNGKDVTGKDLINALENLLSKQSIDPDQKPSLGCNIKWKK